MLAERLGTTLQAARDELEAAKKRRDDDKAVLKRDLSANLKAVDERYRKKAKAFLALVRALEAETDEATEPKSETPTE